MLGSQRLFRAVIAVALFWTSAMLQAVDNPFSRMEGINDCDVMKFNGEYFITGNWLSGDMLSSRDLVNWGNRKNVITKVGAWASRHPREDAHIHASDPNYVDGTFHLFFQVDEGIGHATARSPWGMYVEPTPNTAFSSSIDAEYFRDDDGRHYFYKVEFSNGNVIAGQAMSDPNTLIGSSVRLLSATAGWETARADSINEGPSVFKYRDRYYMLYNANHTAYPEYQIGCVDALTPLGFSNARKYPAPVIGRRTVGDGEIHTIGQPWVVEGPNGFERWAGYFAIYSPDGGGRYQCVDRIHFFDRKLFVDGPTSRYSSGYHPDPAKPTLLGLFNVPDGALPRADWSPIGAGSWSVTNREALQVDQSSWSLNPVNRDAATHYLIEANVKFNSGVDNEDKAGVLAYYEDPRNWMIIGVDRVVGNWYAHRHEQGVDRIVAGPLRAGWKHTDYHKIRVERNGSTFSFRLDGLIPVGATLPIQSSFTGKGRPGIYTDHTSASFDGILYTIGWDEFDRGVGGWGDSVAGSVRSGVWDYGVDGLQQRNTSGFSRIFKGDLMAHYEATCQVYPGEALAENKLAGMLPVYIDDSNYLSAEIDRTRLIVRGKTNGTDLAELTSPVADAESYNLRAVKLADRVILFLDGREVMTVSARFGPSQVGLLTRNMAARFNGILVYRTEPLALPTNWEARDIGTVGFPGRADYSGGTFVVDGSGADIWDRADGGHFVYQRLVGDGQIVARLDSIDPTDYWAKAGLMFRENFNANSRMVYLCSNADTGSGDQHQFMWRETAGGGTGISVHLKKPLLPEEGWMKLTRQGNTFTGYYSTNGTAWSSIGTRNVPMAAAGYIGLAVTSHNNSRVAGAVFEHVSVLPQGTIATLAANPDSVTYGQSVALRALVTSVNNSPTGTVSFTFNGGGVLASAALQPQTQTSSVATVTLDRLPAGTNDLLAVFVGNANFGRSQGAPIKVTVQPRTATVIGVTAADKVYDGQLTATIIGSPVLAGVVAGDQVSLSGVGTARFTDANIGDGKAVSVSGYSLTGADARNYILVQPAGLEANIFRRLLTVSAMPASREYGATNPIFIGTLSGIQAGENIIATYTTIATAASEVGIYSIIPSVIDPAGGLSNYRLVSENAVLTVTKAPLTVRADEKIRRYGSLNPEFTGTVLGLKNNDRIAATFNASAGPASAVGRHPIVAELSDPDNKLNNYAVIIDNAILTIERAPLTVRADDATRVYGAANPLLTGAISGLQNNDRITASFSAAADAASGVGDYAITTELADPDERLINYSVTRRDGTLTVLRAGLVVKANDTTRLYGATNPIFTGTISGIQNADIVAVEYSTTATVESAVGEYPITPRLSDPVGSGTNYTVTLLEGLLRILEPSRARVTVRTSPPGRVVTVDAETFREPVTFNWVVGSSHTIAVPSPQASVDEKTRYLFRSWSDGAAQTQEVIAPAVGIDITATFATQYLLEVLVQPSTNHGRVDLSAAGPWFDAEEKVRLTAVPNAEFIFSHWLGFDLASQNAIEVAMSGPRTLTALFAERPELAISGQWGQSGHFEIRFHGTAGIYRLEASEDLAGWEGLQTYVSPGGEASYIDSASSVKRRRFYRVVQMEAAAKPTDR